MARILVVENSTFMSGALKFILEHSGHAVVSTAADGKEAMDLYKIYRPELVTLDVSMGGLDGLPILKSLRQADPDAKVVMVYVTGQEGKVDEAQRLGAIGAIEKPYKFQDIADEIQRVLKASQENISSRGKGESLR